MEIFTMYNRPYTIDWFIGNSLFERLMCYILGGERVGEKNFEGGNKISI